MDNLSSLPLRYNSWLCSPVHTPPRTPPQRASMGSRLVKLAALFYGGFAAAAVLISSLSGRELVLGGDHLPTALLAGLLTAAGTVTIGLLAHRSVPVVRVLADEVAPALLEGSSVGGLVLVSLLSGLGEELLFRGALQPLVGIVVSSILFGLFHIGPDRRYLLWTAWAIAAGFLFGYLYEWSGGLLAPVVAHATHNAVTLVLWRRRWMLHKGPAAAERGGLA